MPSLAAADLLQLLLLVLLPLPNVTSDTRNIPSLILDTDMDFDVDDVGALCLAHSLQVKQFILSETSNFYPLLCLISDAGPWRTYSITNECDFCALKDLGEAELVAVVHSTGYPTAIGAVSVINHFFGRDDILLGAFKGEFGREVVFEFLTQ